MKNSFLPIFLLLVLFSMNSCKKNVNPSPAENSEQPFEMCVIKNILEIKSQDLIEDTYVSGFNGGNQLSFGSERTLAVGSWRGVEDINGMFHDNITYLKFDYAQVPASVTIDSAFITLYVDTFRYNLTPKYIEYGHSIADVTKNIRVSNVTGDWSESTMNYFNQPASSIVNSTTTRVTTDRFQTYKFNVTDIVKEQMISGNKGFKIEMINPSGHNWLLFASSENAYPSLCPKITLFY